jgi:hypothetical protein
VRDAALIALIETAVPVWSLDADLVAGELGIRSTTARDTLTGSERGGYVPSAPRSSNGGASPSS